jgi:hypothetical protein
MPLVSAVVGRGPASEPVSEIAQRGGCTQDGIDGVFTCDGLDRAHGDTLGAVAGGELLHLGDGREFVEHRVVE